MVVMGGQVAGWQVMLASDSLSVLEVVMVLAFIVKVTAVRSDSVLAFGWRLLLATSLLSILVRPNVAGLLCGG